MSEYLVLLVQDRLGTFENNVQTVPNATRVLNEYTAQGWQVTSIVPGTSPLTFTSLYVTLRRD